MERLAKKVNGEKRILYVAYGWSKQNVKAAAGVEEDEKARADKSKAPPTREADTGKSQASDTPLKDDLKVSPGAGRFFKNKE